ncbi:hypothetical protein EVC62_02155 [Salinicola endophyticus]|uniref:HK97 gp10 family phage protein n=1 Tax=Salinicola endophyticus TaxID=1949083 RepID=A0ABY8FC76_9GAMM|nr:HK97-gp10 family putative phage morphogenesis protein [Salinicola endophyticus]WFF40397.1 hypothetical protein EVC62_02155 [Salinicola endophyticus]
MNTTHLDWSTLPDLEAELQLLSKAESERVLRQGARAGAGVFRDEARRRAKKRTGKLAKNIVSDTAKVTSRTKATAGVKVREEGKASNPRNAFYWRFIEYGTSTIPAAPFIRPSFDAKQEEAARAAFAKLNESIDRVLTR